MSADVPRRLGRGLEALISTARQQREPVAPAASNETPSALQTLAISQIRPNHFQPRRNFAPEELAELQSSLKVSGLLQPVVVRRAGTGFELVAGERRLRAATGLGWETIPAYVRDFDDREMLTLALVENLQRSDLNALEEAEGYQRLIDEFGLTQQQVADAVGKDRTTVTNLLRVLSLPKAVRDMVAQRHISAGHARALLVLKNERQQNDLAGQIVSKQLSVRDVEALARSMMSGKSTGAKRGGSAYKPAPSVAADPEVRRIEDRLRKALQTDVVIQSSADNKGQVRISFYGTEDLDRLLHLLVGSTASDFD